MEQREPFHLSLLKLSKSNSDFFIKKTVLQAASNCRLHSHDFFEIELMIDGYGYQYINGKKYTIQPGLFYFLSPADIHELYFSKETTVLNISISHSLIPDNLDVLLAAKKTDLLCYLENDELDYIKDIFINAYNEFANKKKYYEVVIKNYVQVLITLILRKMNLSPEIQTNNTPTFKAINYMKLHFTQSPSLETVAQKVFLNPSYLSTSIKKVTGIGFSDYLLKLKINHAKKLLTNTSHTIMDIAMNSGFGSINNFNRAFKKITGMTPSQFKQSSKNKV